MLWLDEIQDAILRSNQNTTDALQCKNTHGFPGSVSASIRKPLGGLKDAVCVCPAVSQSIQAINEAVDGQDAAQTLAALRHPGAGLYGITSECAQTYQDDLAKVKEEKKKAGEERSETVKEAFILTETRTEDGRGD